MASLHFCHSDFDSPKRRNSTYDRRESGSLPVSNGRKMPLQSHLRAMETDFGEFEFIP
jgi:hypothetical protein